MNIFKSDYGSYRKLFVFAIKVEIYKLNRQGCYLPRQISQFGRSVKKKLSGFFIKIKRSQLSRAIKDNDIGEWPYSEVYRQGSHSQ